MTMIVAGCAADTQTAPEPALIHQNGRGPQVLLLGGRGDEAYCCPVVDSVARQAAILVAGRAH